MQACKKPRFVDIHSHILWGMDDGAASLADAVAILRDAAACGTTDIVATPHANDTYAFQPELIRDRIAELQAAFDGIRIHRGCDFHLSASNIGDALRNPGKFTINGQRYLLVEFPEHFILPATEHVLFRLAQAGMTAVITHPERNSIFQRDTPRVCRLADMGYVIQLTADSLLGQFGAVARESAWSILSAGGAHVVASDAHDPVFRTARLAEAYKKVSSRLGEETAIVLFSENPGEIVESGEVIQLDRTRRRSFSLSALISAW
jgi:protein-tyrosine phosphatase